MLTPRVTELPPLPATIARSLVATGIGPTVHITTDPWPTEVFGPDRPNARRAAMARVERAQATLDSMSGPDVSPGMGVDVSSGRYGTALRQLRDAERDAAPYWAG